jgi:hypothetical protein
LVWLKTGKVLGAARTSPALERNHCRSSCTIARVPTFTDEVPGARQDAKALAVAQGHFWWRLPPSARAALWKHGVTSEDGLADLPLGGSVGPCRSDAALQPFQNLVCVVKSALLDSSPNRLQVLETAWEKEMMRVPSRLESRTLHDALGVATALTPPIRPARCLHRSFSC